MGIRLITQAQTVATTICRTDKARLVLQRMCLSAKDSDTHPRYHAGSDVLAMALGYHPEDPAGQRAVRRALAELVDVGLVEQVVGSTPRTWNRRWLIRIPDLPGVTSLPNPDEPVEKPVDDGAETTPTSRSDRTPPSAHDRTPTSAQSGHHRPLREVTTVRTERTPVSAPEEGSQETSKETPQENKPRNQITATSYDRPQVLAR